MGKRNINNNNNNNKTQKNGMDKIKKCNAPYFQINRHGTFQPGGLIYQISHAFYHDYICQEA